MVGCLQWAAQQCCPWISKGVHQISRHTHNPSDEHVRLAKHCIKHLLKDINKGESFTKKNISIKRPGGGISPMKWDSIIGRIADKDYQLDEQL